VIRVALQDACRDNGEHQNDDSRIGCDGNTQPQKQTERFDSQTVAWCPTHQEISKDRRGQRADYQGGPIRNGEKCRFYGVRGAFACRYGEDKDGEDARSEPIQRRPHPLKPLIDSRK